MNRRLTKLLATARIHDKLVGYNYSTVYESYILHFLHPYIPANQMAAHLMLCCHRRYDISLHRFLDCTNGFTNTHPGESWLEMNLGPTRDLFPQISFDSNYRGKFLDRYLHLLSPYCLYLKIAVVVPPKSWCALGLHHSLYLR